MGQFHFGVFAHFNTGDDTIQELISGTGTPTRGIRLWITVAEMRRPGRKLQIHSGAGLLTMYGTAEPEITETELRQGTMIRANIPF